jgi:hypothetical protein
MARAQQGHHSFKDLEAVVRAEGVRLREGIFNYYSVLVTADDRLGA